MPSDFERVTIALAVVVTAGVAAVAGRPLLGAFLGVVIYTVGWLVDRASPGHPAAVLGRIRRILVAAGAVLVVAYSVLVARELVLGVTVAGTLALAAWVTSPVGPVAAWLDG